jgi:hypothetical protein
MIGSFGIIPESIGAGAEDLSHRQRFGSRGGDPRLREFHWQRGRDLLLVDITSAEAETHANLPSRPKRLTEEQLWIPVSDTETRIVGPIYRIGSRAVGSLIRIRAETDVYFLPDLFVVLAARRARVLGAIDGLDPSRRRQMEKVIRSSRACDLNPATLFPEPPGTTPPVTSVDGLPPAAKTILTTIEQSLLGTSHVLSFQRRGAGGLVNLLENRGLIRVLPSGQIIASARYVQLRETLSDPELDFDPKQLSKLWGTSTGMAGALLDSFALDGMLDRVSARHYKRRGDDPA